MRIFNYCFWVDWFASDCVLALVGCAWCVYFQLFNVQLKNIMIQFDGKNGVSYNSPSDYFFFHFTLLKLAHLTYCSSLVYRAIDFPPQMLIKAKLELSTRPHEKKKMFLFTHHMTQKWERIIKTLQFKTPMNVISIRRIIGIAPIQMRIATRNSSSRVRTHANHPNDAMKGFKYS